MKISFFEPMIKEASIKSIKSPTTAPTWCKHCRLCHYYALLHCPKQFSVKKVNWKVEWDLEEELVEEWHGRFKSGSDGEEGKVGRDVGSVFEERMIVRYDTDNVWF